MPKKKRIMSIRLMQYGWGMIHFGFEVSYISYMKVDTICFEGLFKFQTKREWNKPNGEVLNYFIWSLWKRGGSGRKIGLIF